MNSIVLQATINEADYPIFLGLFEKFNVKTVLLKKKVGKKTYPIETAIPILYVISSYSFTVIQFI